MTKKRKNRNSSGNDSGNVTNRKAKVSKQRGPSADTSELNTSVSDILGKVNAVLYDKGGNNSNDSSDCNSGDTSVFVVDSGPETERGEGKMADGGREPTNQDLMKSNQELMKCMENITNRLVTMEKKLGAIDSLEKKVTDFERELNKVWVALDERAKRTDERVNRLEDRVDSADVGAGLISSRVSDLEKQRDRLTDEVAYLKSQSMRNNLIFTNITEDNSSGNEPSAVTERKLREHLHEKLKIAKETVDTLRFERVHRTPAQPVKDKVRTVVAKFTFFKDREMVRKQWPQLDGTNFRVYEQFPPEVIEKRRRLVPKLKAAKSQGKRAWIAYDTLYVDGEPVRQ